LRVPGRRVAAMPVDPAEDERERVASAEEDEVERRLRLGQHGELFPDLLDAVEAEPLRERRWRQLMLALSRCGRQVEALRTFRRLRETLGELGLEPSPQSIELDRAIVLSPHELDWTGPDSIAY
jgi:DNA-binding SARP family transcriptional activator